MTRTSELFGALPKSLVALTIAILSTIGPISTSTADTCVASDRGDGTVDLPPLCDFASLVMPRELVEGLPPGTTIRIDSGPQWFSDVTTTPGGSLGGEIQRFSSILSLSMTGTGDFSRFHRVLEVPLEWEIHAAPRQLGAPVQSFETVLFSLEGQLDADPDFAHLRVEAGEAHGLPSPGHTTLFRLSAEEFAVDGWFDVAYRFDFVGAPGSMLEGTIVSTHGAARMVTSRAPTIPTFTTWGAIALAVLLLVLGLIAARRRGKVNRGTS